MRNLLLPPIVWLVAIAAMLALHAYFPLLHAEPTPWRTGIGLLGLGLAMVLTIWHKRLFRARKTNVNTFGKPDRLVDEGLYRHIRNPMYLGFLLALAALAFVMGALSPWLIVLAFYLLTDRWYIPFEEQAMRECFGEQYDQYISRTRRWI